MSKYLAPTSDVVFKKIFGRHPHLLKSFLNALLPLEEGREIIHIDYLPSEQVPEIPEFKRTIADVLCKDQTGRHFIVEMQIAWVNNFKPRLAFETSKAFSRQITTGEDYCLLQPVYGLGLIGESFDPRPNAWYHHFKFMNTDVNPHDSMDYLHLIFVELPKVPLISSERKKLGILWLRFMREINEKTKQVSPELLAIPEISEAIQLSEEAAYSPHELRYYESYWDEIRRVNALVNGGVERGEARGKIEGRAEGLEKGALKAKQEIAVKMLSRGIDLSEITELTGLSKEEIQNLIQ